MAVVGDAEVAPTRAVPVAEQHGQGAVAGRERDRGSVARAPGRRAEEQRRRAGVRLDAVGVEPDILAERERGQAVAPLPGGAERHLPARGLLEPPGVVGELEPAAAQPSQQLHPADPQDHQIGVAVAVDVDGVGAHRARDVRDRAHDLAEGDGPAHSGDVPEQRRRVVPARDKDVGPPVAVAVEHRHPAPDHGRVPAAVDVVQAGRRRLVDEVRCPRAPSPARVQRPPGEPRSRRHPARPRRRRRRAEDDRPPHAHPSAAHRRRRGLLVERARQGLRGGIDRRHEAEVTSGVPRGRRTRTVGTRPMLRRPLSRRSRRRRAARSRAGSRRRPRAARERAARRGRPPRRRRPRTRTGRRSRTRCVSVAGRHGRVAARVT